MSTIKLNFNYIHFLEISAFISKPMTSSVYFEFVKPIKLIKMRRIYNFNPRKVEFFAMCPTDQVQYSTESSRTNIHNTK